MLVYNFIFCAVLASSLAGNFEVNMKHLFSKRINGALKQDCINSHFIENGKNIPCDICFVETVLSDGSLARNGTCFGKGFCDNPVFNCCMEIIRMIRVPESDLMLPFVVGCTCQWCKGQTSQDVEPLQNLLFGKITF